MSKPIKKIIAREGLIICSIIIAGMTLMLIGEHISQYTKLKPLPEGFVLDPDGEPFIYGWGVLLLIGGYPLYLLIRFIIWAIRTLRG